jgi:predicted AAA+ superfamily ATPase
VRQIQKHIIEAYEQDFSKHAPNTEVPKIRQVWNSIPSQLAKENRKFVYGLIREGGRVKEYETVIMWLGDCGLVHRVSRVNAAGVPLKAYEDQKAFKLYMLDVGLQQKTLLDGDRLFAEFKGALTEQYACQQPETLDDASVYYYTNDRGSCEVDFVLSIGGKTVPLEVKDETNLKAKSLKTFREKDEPELSIRMSMADYREEDGLVDLPLYAAEEIKETVH